jgi:hypothetical protein
VDFKITKPGFYKARNGEKIEVVGRAANGRWVGLDARGSPTAYSDDGIYRPEWGNNKCQNDLVAEWVEPKRIKGWLAIGVKGEREAGLSAICGNIGLTQEDATNSFNRIFAKYSPVACIEIDVAEGQGLDGSAS